MQGIFQKENTDKALKYGIYRHLPTYEKIIRNLVSFSHKEVQITSDIVVNMCEQPEDYAVYVSKEDLQKEKYISELNMLFEVDDNWNLSSNRIKDIIICMQRWFRSLQQATRNVIYLDQYVDNDNMVQAMKTMKKAMQKVEFNPFEILFVEFPEAFGTESLPPLSYHMEL